jgi:hypothetical protein
MNPLEMRFVCIMFTSSSCASLYELVPFMIVVPANQNGTSDQVAKLVGNNILTLWNTFPECYTMYVGLDGTLVS